VTPYNVEVVHCLVWIGLGAAQYELYLMKARVHTHKSEPRMSQRGVQITYLVCIFHGFDSLHVALWPNIALADSLR
jgi:hypothetical protein